MSEFKSKQVFEQKLSSHRETQGDQDDAVLNEPVEQQDLTAHMQFADNTKFVPSAIDDHELDQQPERDLEQVVKPSKKRNRLFAVGITAFSGLLIWQSIDSLITAYQAADWLALGWSGFIASLATLGVTAIGKELLKLKRLRNHFEQFEQAEDLIRNNGLGKGKSFCQNLAKQGGMSSDNLGYKRWHDAVNSTHTDSEVLDMYQAMVINQQDEKAKKLVTKISSEACVLVAASPLATVDMLLVAWRNFTLIDKLADIYGVELGYWSRLKLFKLVLVNMAAAGASELVADASIDLLSMDLAGKVSTRVAQGFGVGILTARLGLKAISLLRPIPFAQSKRLKLAEVRKGLLTSLKSSIKP